MRLVDHLNAPQQELLDALGIDPTQPVPDLAGKMARIRTPGATFRYLDHRGGFVFLRYDQPSGTQHGYCRPHGRPAQEIFAIYKRFAENLPKHKQIPPGRSNTEELFWPTINSRISVATAGAVDVKSAQPSTTCTTGIRQVGRDVESIDASLNIARMYGNIIEETTARGFKPFLR